MDQRLVDSTVRALRTITHPRFFESERGYQGVFSCALSHALREAGIAHGKLGEPILEEEYQKGFEKHGTIQRPDLIFHIPTPGDGNRKENNYAVWAFKRDGDVGDATSDFLKLDSMFDNLNYPLGIWINIDSHENHLEGYGGPCPDRLVTISVKLAGGIPKIRWARMEVGAIVRGDVS